MNLPTNEPADGFGDLFVTTPHAVDVPAYFGSDRQHSIGTGTVDANGKLTVTLTEEGARLVKERLQSPSLSMTSKPFAVVEPVDL